MSVHGEGGYLPFRSKGGRGRYLPWPWLEGRGAYLPAHRRGVPTLVRDTYPHPGYGGGVGGSGDLGLRSTYPDGQCLPWTRGTYQEQGPGKQSSTMSTCYAAGGMPLVFMQEDFLVMY